MALTAESDGLDLGFDQFSHLRPHLHLASLRRNVLNEYVENIVTASTLLTDGRYTGMTSNT